MRLLSLLQHDTVRGPGLSHSWLCARFIEENIIHL